MTRLGTLGGSARPLGRSSVTVSTFGLGTAPLAGMFESVPEREAIGTVERALARGVTYFDTAPMYGTGTAERRLGRALRGVPRKNFAVSTKVGRVLTPGRDEFASMFADGDRQLRATFDFSAAATRQTLEASLERLGLDRVDIVYVHDPDDHIAQAVGETIPALQELRGEGLVGAIGLGVNSARTATAIMRRAALDVVMLAGRHTLLDRSATQEALPLAAAHGVSVIAAGVLNSGILAAPVAGATFDYLPTPPATLCLAQRLEMICADHGVPLAAAALRHPARHRAVAGIVVGCRSPRELDENLDLFATPVPAACYADLDAAVATHRAHTHHGDDH